MTDARDIAVGLFATGVRAGAAAGRLALLPVRLAARAPVVGPPLQRAGEALASDGVEAQARSREQLETAAGDLLAAPEVERAVDQALAGPLTDTFARSLAKHRVAERVAAEIAASRVRAGRRRCTRPRGDAAARRPSAGEPGLERLVIEALESRLTAEVTDRALDSPEMQRVVEHVARAPRCAQPCGGRPRHWRRSSWAAFDAAPKRRRHRRAEVPQASGCSRPVRRSRHPGVWARHRRPARPDHLPHRSRARGACGLAGRRLATGLARSGSRRCGVGLVSGTYFVLFWTAAGQTPGMRLMRLRVSDQRGQPPSVGRSVVRFVGLVLAIVPLFAGFLPVSSTTAGAVSRISWPARPSSTSTVSR